jgi:RHH-type transcriptional regulator, proline utilization regulon repressor / proline dehydrogenase / delta 1-pyrroline-5-carboxylate dehydrogenase
MAPSPFVDFCGDGRAVIYIPVGRYHVIGGQSLEKSFGETNATHSLQQEIEAKGLEIFTRMKGEKPGVFKNITGRLMDWSMRDEVLKTQMFRFVDVLPTLSSSREIARHAGEYLDGVKGGLPAPLLWGARISQRVPWLMAWAARRGVTQLGKTFILARNGREAIPALRAMRRQRLAFTVDILGETAVSEIEARHYQSRYLELIESLAQEAGKWPAVEQIDRDDQGEIPRVNISVKLSALFSQVHPADPETAIDRISARLRPLMLAASQRGVFINLDMESTALKDITLEVFKRLLDEPELRGYPHAGLAFQAYLRDSERDFDALLAWAMARNRRITIRLIKGAYWDYESVLARQRDWPSPVFENKAETDANYEKLARRMLENPRFINCAFATHNVRSAAACMVHAEKLGISRRSFEFQMLHGMAEPIKLALAGMGYRVRDYCPVGETLPGMSYLVRRLLENTSNEGFLRATYNEGVKPLELLRDPATIKAESGKQKTESRSQKPEVRSQEPGVNRSQDERGVRMELFENEPLTDFKIADNRRRMQEALQAARADFGRKYPLVIGGRDLWTEREILSINPARPSEIVGRVAKGGRAEAAAAVEAARAAFRAWSRTSVEERAGVLTRTAELLRRERFELAALEVFEEGKPWMEADGDVAEAIDFCNFYAAQMRRLAGSRYAVPGETSLHQYIPRGIAAVIAPWNFPLAILCGMTTAAVVAGNTVVMKPAEQSPVIAWRLMDILQRAGLPPGVVNFLPGPGEEAGSYLVEHPEVTLIAFTGSRKVGLGIYEAAGRVRPGQKQLKHAVCEMGGKNAMIIDDGADVDEATPAIVYSAFGYQGQKCSALSRLIVLKDNYDRVLDRLIEACRDLQVGPPEAPGTIVGPVIDKAAYDSILGYIQLGKQEGKLAFQGQVPEGEGYFIPPTIFTDISFTARVAQEEIFGPVLCVFKAKNLDEALQWANGTEYALTGGLFSRSPGNIERVKAELEAGNLYINRSMTGAMVARHPFGGFKMSGGGTKAGGRDYLLHFLLPRVVTENDMRRGFVPE